MTAKGVLLAAGPALLGLVAGLVMGRNWDQHAAVPSAASHANATHSNGTKNLKPPLPGKPPTRPMEPVRFAAATDLARTMTIEEVTAALQTALAEKNQSKRYQAVQRIAGAVAVADIQKALALAESIRNRDLKANFVSMLASRWAESDPVSAMTYAQRMSNMQQRNQTVANVLGIWAAHDSAAALAWYQQLAPGQLRNQAKWNLVSALAQENPQAAFDVVQALPFGPYEILCSTKSWQRTPLSTCAALRSRRRRYRMVDAASE